MYKVLIADDERLVLNTISMLIETHFPDHIESTILAKSGNEAVALALQEKPDIVIMDIRMPGINGIEAIVQIKKHLPKAVFIIISAYDEFNYAHRALEIGVCRYILKPVNKRIVLDVIQTSLSIIEEEYKQTQTALENKEMLEIVRPYIESQFVYSVIFNAQGRQKYLLDYKDMFSLSWQKGRAICIDVEPKEGMRVLERGMIDHGLFETIRNRLTGAYKCIVANLSANRYIAIVFEPKVGFLSLLKMKDYYFKIGIGTLCSGEEGLYTSYIEATKAIKNADWGQTVYFDSSVHEEDGEQGVYPYQYEKEFIKALWETDEQRCDELFNSIFEWFVKKYPYSFNDIKYGLTQLAVPMMRVGIDRGRDFGRSVLETQDYLNYYSSITSPQQLRDWFIANIKKKCSALRRFKKDIDGVIINLQEEIERDFRKKITLKQAADIVNLSPTYFSYFIKKLTGKTYLEFVMDIKINKANDMLKTTSMSIKIIAYSLGFNSTNYFCRVYKNKTGKTPTQYRKE